MFTIISHLHTQDSPKVHTKCYILKSKFTFPMLQIWHRLFNTFSQYEKDNIVVLKVYKMASTCIYDVLVVGLSSSFFNTSCSELVSSEILRVWKKCCQLVGLSCVESFYFFIGKKAYGFTSNLSTRLKLIKKNSAYCIIMKTLTERHQIKLVFFVYIYIVIPTTKTRP